MSVRASELVWKHSNQGGSQLLMLLAIADYADDRGRAYPSVAGLATKCRMKPRNANYLLSDLQRSGELRVEPNAGPKGANVYQILFEAMKSGAAPLHSGAGVDGDEGVHCSAGDKDAQGLQAGAGVGVQPSAPLQELAPLQSSVGTPALECAKPLHCSADEPSLNRQEPKRKRTAAAARAQPSEFFPDVDAQVLADWETVREAKRAGAVTLTAAKKIRTEAEKAGLTPQAVLEICCERGWVGFNASWSWSSSSSGRSANGVAL